MKQDIHGLNGEQVEEFRAKHGTNALTAEEVESFRDKLIGNFQDPIIKILMVALGINVVFFFMGKAEWYESLGIAIAVLLATFISTWSEYSNESSFQKLQEEASKIMCKVFRGELLQEIPIDDIVVGDYVLLQPGDKIPADGRLYRGFLKADQASLTGESKEVKKRAPEEEHNSAEKETENSEKTRDLNSPYHLFRGTIAVSGEAILLVEEVGDSTFYGGMAREMQIEDRDSPLKVKLKALAEGISKFGYIGGGLIALSFMFKKVVLDSGFDPDKIALYFSTWQTPVNDLVTAVILAIIIIVVAVPEGLPLMIAMVLSLNMRKLLADNLLVRKLIGIETAGSLNLLFSDKTGTITKGQLEVVSFNSGGGETYTDIDSLPGELRTLMELSLTQNTSSVVSNCDETGCHLIVGGNATDRALLGYLNHHNCKTFAVEKINEVPFTSDAKLSAVEVKGEYNLTLVKGAAEVLLEKCTHYYDAAGELQKLESTLELEKEMDALANRAIRVIAVAASEESIIEENIPEKLNLVGIVGIRDEIRPESISAIKEAQAAGIQVVMITGDKKETALAIARESGLLEEENQIVLSSEELNKLTDEELKEMLPRIRVIARALPSDKSRLVKIAQELDLVVGMTGDGVNDAPALKKADVGFAMGSGTEVSKEASDIVVLDDNFLSITKSVLYGRTIFHSIRKFIVYQLTVNVAAILVAFIGPFIGIDLPFSMTQMLWINLVMDTLAALAFGGEAALGKYMHEEPKKRTEPIISKNMWSSILTNGLFIAGLSIFFLKSPFIRSLFRNGAPGMADAYFLTGFFAFFIFLNTFNTFNARTEGMNLFAHIRENKLFLKVVGIIFAVQIVMTYLGGEVLRTAGLTLEEWFAVVLLSVTIIPLDLLRKAIFKARKNS